MALKQSPWVCGVDGPESLMVEKLIWGSVGAGGGAGWEAQWLSEVSPIGAGCYHPSQQPLVLEVASERQKGTGPQEDNFSCCLPLFSSSFRG